MEDGERHWMEISQREKIRIKRRNDWKIVGLMEDESL